MLAIVKKNFQDTWAVHVDMHTSANHFMRAIFSHIWEGFPSLAASIGSFCFSRHSRGPYLLSSRSHEAERWSWTDRSSLITAPSLAVRKCGRTSRMLQSERKPIPLARVTTGQVDFNSTAEDEAQLHFASVLLSSNLWPPQQFKIKFKKNYCGKLKGSMFFPH